MKGVIAQATLRTTAVLVLRLLVQAATLLILARLLGPSDYGSFAGIASLAMMLGTLSTFGTHIVLLSDVSRTPSKQSEILPFALSTTLLCGSFLLIIYFLISHIIPNGVGTTPEVKSTIGLSELLVLPLISLRCAEHQGRGKIASSQMLLTLPLLLRMLIAILVWLLAPLHPLNLYAYGYLTASLASLIITTLTIKEAWPTFQYWRLPTISELRQSAGYAVLNITAAGPTELDKALATRVLPPVPAGIYAAAARIVGATTIPVIAMMLSVMPRLFREGRTDTLYTLQFVTKLIILALAYSVLLDIGLWMSAPLLDQLFGEHYANLHDAIRWLCLAVPGLCLRITLGGVLMSLGHPWLRATFEIAGIATMCAAALSLPSKFGLGGMALALGCSEWSMTVIGGIILIHLLRRDSTRS
jgi:O-antigen/teichoic acid export membrane protein